MFSTKPDPWMEYIYDDTDPRYHLPETRDLRERRARALASAPEWMRATRAGTLAAPIRRIR